MASHDPIRMLLRLAGLPEARAEAVEIGGGGDPVLQTPYRVGEAAVAAIAAGGIAAAELWGPPQRICLDLHKAAATLRSSHYLEIDGARVPTERNAVMGMYPARNGRWSYIHANFPHHRAAALRVLGVPEERAAVKSAIARWDALELEDAIIAAGGAGGMVRSADEWRAHPQGIAVAALPLLEIRKLGDSAPEPLLPRRARPLSGVRVLDVTRVLAGPTCGRTLAEHGADVMKISAAHLPIIPYQEYDTGHGKLAAHLDLREAANVAQLKTLVRQADVFSQGYRPGSLAARGLSAEELAALRPGLVYVSLSAFGPVGPWAARRGFDTVVQNMTGMTLRQGQLFPRAGTESGAPQFYPCSAIDYCAGYLMAFGTMVALGRRAREGGSWLVRTSLAQVGGWLTGLGEVPERELAGVPTDFTAEEIARWTTVTETPAGRLKHLTPVLSMAETPPRWARPAVPLGYHAPVWPAREAA